MNWELTEKEFEDLVNEYIGSSANPSNEELQNAKTLNELCEDNEHINSNYAKEVQRDKYNYYNIIDNIVSCFNVATNVFNKTQ